MPIDETDAVARDELLLRAVPNVRDYYDPDRPKGPFTRQAFSPTQNDVDGLSVYREAFVSPSELAHWMPRKGDYYVVGMPSIVFVDQGLTIVPSPRDGPKGHCTIPELSHEKVKQNRRWAKELGQRLAKQAESAIVFRPGDDRPA